MNRQKEIIVVRAAIVGKGDGILALRRALGTNPATSHKLELLGGQVDTGEKLPQALLREAREETGLEIALISPLEQFDGYTITDGDKAGTPYRAFCCLAIAVGGQFRLSTEHTDYTYQPPAVMARSADFRPDTPLAIRKLF
jgi:8-oxo-dGTP pyrophosphatase MutT (NUDIX family)